ncbi:MAG: FAD-dependent thymidylate synthase [Brevefilum sp.]|nr:FAD-dependent thymidylate synthase [Brevefilum sp.]MDT8381633.1 FAD-dependent thymidylate synthase [Brevefilum sp.]MDW7753867.1 FAD-dependent thymidylate synthase [Brevefilum sp.]
MTRNRRIYLLSPRDLSPETIAVTFAKTSRSPKPFDEIASELTDDRSAEFHEKWVVGYGHASVAEHAVLHLALENVSRLAIETIEGNRLASYTEKSSRYQQWDQDAFYIPEELGEGKLMQVFIDTCHLLFNSYQESIPVVESWLKMVRPQNQEESDSAYHRRIRGEAVDNCRFLLPAASLANVGVTINARALEYAICKMLSSPLEEVRDIGENLREVGQNEAPTLVKYAACNQYLVNAGKKLSDYAKCLSTRSSKGELNLLDWDKTGEQKILAALLYRFGADCDFQACLEYVQSLSQDEFIRLASDLMSGRGKFDQPLREFEYAQMTFDLVMDQGAYFEFKRHRMMTQTTGALSPKLGFAVPRAITEAGCEEDYIKAMRKAAQVYDEIAELNRDAASYIIPNAYNRRVLCTMNLREFFNFCRLRSAENAHFSIRRISLWMAEKVENFYPILGSYLDRPKEETWRDIENRYFSQV